MLCSGLDRFVENVLSPGFTLGDELGFKESLTNIESNKRRSVQDNSKLQAAIIQAQQEATEASIILIDNINLLITTTNLKNLKKQFGTILITQKTTTGN